MTWWWVDIWGMVVFLGIENLGGYHGDAHKDQ